MSVLTIDEAIQLGMGRSANTGAFSTGKVGGGAGTTILIDEPEFIIGVPAGICIRPFYVHAQLQAGVTTTDSDEAEILLAVDSLGYWNGNGTSTPCNPSNLRTDLDKGSMCTVAQAVTGALTTTPGYAIIAAADPVLDIELDRVVNTTNFGTNVGISDVILELKYEPEYPLFIIGPATLVVYCGGTRATIGNFVQAQWIEGQIAEMIPAV